jgi:serine/threonine protein kinase/photosystem II stability/assembly factor-like uncharacterized protein
MVGSVIDNYKIVGILGEGGMGVVYKGFDTKLERFVAIKILDQQALKNPKFIERFKREAKNQAKLNHPNIVPVYGFTEFNGLLGIIMEFVAGETLEHLIERKSKLELSEAVGILKQVLAGVGFAHSKGFIHRDLKPSNIIINYEGIAKIMDFGISKSLNDVKAITKTGTKLGTVLYMSPEQIKAQEPTIQSDIYSLGITFYEMLCGKTPFEAPTDFHIMEAHLKKNPLKLTSILDDIHPDVDIVLGKALSKTVSKRYQTCDEFSADLDSIPLTPYKSKKKTKRITKQKTAYHKPRFRYRKFFRRLKITALSILGLAVFAALSYFIYQQVSQLLTSSGQQVQKLIDNGKDIYSSNPSYVAKSKWQAITCPVAADLYGLVFLNENNGYACGTNSALIKTTDGGKSWKSIPVKVSNNTFYDIKFFNASTGIIAGSNGIILLTTDGGNFWSQIETGVNETMFAIKVLPNSTIGFLVGGNGTILKSTDSGYTWKRVLSPSRNLLYDVDFSSNYTGYAVGWNAELLKTTDQGLSWVKLNQTGDSYFRSICFADSSLGIIVGGGGEILRTVDGGSNWNVIPSGTISGLYSVSFIDSKNALILGSKGEILETDDGGSKWNLTNSGKFVALTRLVVLPSKKMVVVGYNGTILLSQ